MTIRTYSELCRISTFDDRYSYLKLKGQVGSETFGFNRYLNQLLYTSSRWRKIRDEVIIRDNGCDLGIEGFDVNYRIVIHHMNPITIEDVEFNRPHIFDPEFLISTSEKTHRAIHFSMDEVLNNKPTIRRPNDTKLW